MMRRSFVAVMAMALAAILPQSSSVQAASTLPLAGLDAVANGGDLSTATQISATEFFTDGPGTNLYSGIPNSTAFTASSGDVVLDLTNHTLTTFTNATYGSFVTTSVQIESQSASFLNVYVLGTFAGASSSLRSDRHRQWRYDFRVAGIEHATRSARSRTGQHHHGHDQCGGLWPVLRHPVAIQEGHRLTIARRA